MEIKPNYIIKISIEITEVSLMIALVSVLLWLAKGNQICNGDFETYSPLSTEYSDITYGFFNSSLDCWYNKNLGTFQVKNHLFHGTTVGSQLSVSSPISLCQTVSLNIGTNYQLSFDTFVPPQLSQITFYLHINDVEIDSFYVNDPATFQNRIIIMQPIVNQNEICFSYACPIINAFGGLIDNVTLISLQNNTNSSAGNITQGLNQTNINTSNGSNSTVESETNHNISNESNGENQTNNPASSETNRNYFIIKLEPDIFQKEGKLILRSNFNLDVHDFLMIIQQKLIISYDGELLVGAQILQDQAGLLLIIVPIQKSYDIELLNIYMGQFLMNQLRVSLEFTINEQGIPITCHLSKEEKQFINNADQIMSYLARTSQFVYEFSSSSISAAFIFNLLSFLNLFLLYNFLMLKSFPNFSKTIFAEIQLTFYKNSGLAHLFQSLFDLPTNFFNVKYEEQLIRENMPDTASWFGDYGFSTKFFQNNIDPLLDCSLLLVKLLVLKIIGVLVCQKLKKYFDISINYLNIILLEIIVFAPYIEIGAITNIGFSCHNPYEKLEKVVHLLIMGICFLSVPCWIIYRFGEIKKQMKKKKRIQKAQIQKYLKSLKAVKMIKGSINSSSKPQEDIKKFQNHTEKENCLFLKQETIYLKLEIAEMLLNFTIPVFIIMKIKPAFFLINWIVMVYRIGLAIKFFKIIPLKRRTYQLAMGTVWILYHLAFSILYLLDILGQNNVIKGAEWTKLNIYCAFIIIILLILGCFIDLLMILLSIGSALITLIRKICRNCSENNKVQPKATQQQQSQKKEHEIKIIQVCSDNQ